MQINLFDEIKISGLTFEQAAKLANVSVATIRNWIKAGYLSLDTSKTITKSSFDKFMIEVAGIEKLNARANKSLKDTTPTSKSLQEIYALVQQYEGEQIGKQYENLLSETHKNKEGIYYTPSWIVADMFRNISFQPQSIFLDPCCGSGNFITEALKAGVLPENIYGFDTDENAIFITKGRVQKEFGVDLPYLQVGDFLVEAKKLLQAGKKFDFIFTNPPWGKKVDKRKKEHFAKTYTSGNSLDTTALFLAASLSLLKPNGILGFLVQEAFFNITTFEDIRAKVTEKTILRLIDYGKAFKGLITKAQAIIIENTPPTSKHLVECSFENQTHFRTQHSFYNTPKHILNFWTQSQEAEVINKLYALPHTTLKNKAEWALGIVTGNNQKYCRKSPAEGYIPILKGLDITKNGLQEPSLFIQKDFSMLQQVAPRQMYEAKEKLIYRFISTDLCFFYDNQQRYILNSANLLIPRQIGISAQQLTELLNSDIINWLFKKLFATHKVLRSDLELLPIHIDFFQKYEKFSNEKYLEYLEIEQKSDGTFSLKK
jgi:site-specific DNA-methyltransferase (adenine-specific)